MITVSFEISKNLKISLILNDVKLIWKYIDPSQQLEITTDNFKAENAYENLVECSQVKQIVLAAHETANLLLTIRPRKSTGNLSILGVIYGLSIDNQLLNINGKHLFDIKGARLNNTQQAMRSFIYDVDNRLNFNLINEMALMQIEIDHLPKQF